MYKKNYGYLQFRLALVGCTVVSTEVYLRTLNKFNLTVYLAQVHWIQPIALKLYKDSMGEDCIFVLQPRAQAHIPAFL